MKAPTKRLFQLSGVGLLALCTIGQTASAELRPLTGNVGQVDRGGQTLSAYLDRLESALYLEEARGTVGPYVASVANSLEALPKEELQGRGERLLFGSYVLLSQLSGPQASRMMSFYSTGLGQLMGLKPDEISLSPELRKDLAAIGTYAATTASTKAQTLFEGAARAEHLTHLLLAQGKYKEAVARAKEWEQKAPSPLATAFRAGAEVLSGTNRTAAERTLLETERKGGAPSVVASMLLRRAAREPLLSRLAKVPKAGKGSYPEEGAVRQSCQDKGKGALEGDCLVLLLEGASGAHLDRPPPQGLSKNRAAILKMARALALLLGAPGRKPVEDPEKRQAAYTEVVEILPALGLPEEEQGAIQLVAHLGVKNIGKAELPEDLRPEIDAYLEKHGCSPLALPLYLGRSGIDPKARAEALRGALARCQGADGAKAEGRTAEALRLFALTLLSYEPKAQNAQTTLADLASARAKTPGEGRFLFSLAQGETMRIFGSGAEVRAGDLTRLAGLYASASAALSPYDGAEVKGFIETQIATLLLRRHQLEKDPKVLQELLKEAQMRLRFARVLTPPDESARIEALDVYVSRELDLLEKKVPKAPTVDLSVLPEGTGRRLIACEWLRTARAAKDNAAVARYAKLAAGTPLGETAISGTPRLSTSIGVDERVRIFLRGERSIVVLPRCRPQ